MRLVALSTAIFLAACGSAFAQAGNTQPGNNGKNLDQGKSGQNTNGASEVPDQVKNELAQAGFSDVQVVPGTFLVQAKDKNGQPVMMLIHENSIMGRIAGYPSQGAATTGSGASPGGDSNATPGASSGQGAGSSTNSGSGK